MYLVKKTKEGVLVAGWRPEDELKEYLDEEIEDKLGWKIIHFDELNNIIEEWEQGG